MIIYIASDGQARLVSPQHVYQGSSVTDITVIAPFPAQTAMTVAFSLPDGKMFGGVQGTMQTPPYLMTLLANQPELPDNVHAWQYVMPFAITQNAGQAKVSITAQFAQGSGEAASFTQQTSAQVEFAIEPSVVGTLPDEPTPDVWTQILSYLSAQNTKIAAIQSDVADIEQVADEANTNADTALTTANKANTTATQAKTTADGIDGKATQALTNSQKAEQTAQEAKTTADSLADSIAHANETASQANTTAEEAKEIAEGAAQGNGTRVSVGGAFQQTLSFTSDPQAQIAQNATAVAAVQQSVNALDDKVTTAESNIESIENGTTPVGNANQLGGVDAASYALQDGTYSTLIAGGNTVLDTRTVNSPPSYYADRETCYEFKTTAILGLVDYMPNAEYVLLTSKKGWGGDYIVYQEAVSAGYTQNDIRDSVKCYRYGMGETWGEWKVILAVDPTKLEPSTANGWTQTAANGNLPGAGVYMVVPNVGGGAYGIGVMFYAANRISVATVGSVNASYLLSYEPSANTRWSLYNTEGETFRLSNIYYKRIA